MLESIVEIDIELLIYLNNLGTSSWDGFWMFVTNKLSSIPLYAIIIFFWYKFYGVKKLFITILFVVLLITITDQTTNLFKYGFERLRPCHDESVQNYIRIVKTSCGGLYSFFSGHASNSMAVAIFSSLLLRKHLKYAPCLLVFWSLMVGYSRIYIGVHFPFDVLSGFVFGAIIGWTVYKLLNLSLKKMDYKLKP